MFKLCSSYFKEKKLFLFPLLLVIVIFGLFNNYQVTKSEVRANDLDMDITTLINSQGLGVLIPKVSNNNINTANVRSQTPVPSNLVWPANNDYALAPDLDPNSNGGYIAYVRTPNQYLHAIYGYSSVGDPNPQNYDQVPSSTDSSRKSNITKIVLVADIDLVNTHAPSPTNPDPNNPDITMNYPNTNNKFTLPIWGNLLSNISGNHSGGDGPKDLALQRPSKDNTLTIEANGHSINVGNMAIRTSGAGGNYKMTIILQNATIYNSSFYGYIWG